MIILPAETEALAQRLAEAQSLSVEAVVHEALRAKALAAGVLTHTLPRRRMTLEEVHAMQARIAATPLLDSRPVEEIIDEINEI